jgi:hypothetical protein
MTAEKRPQRSFRGPLGLAGSLRLAGFFEDSAPDLAEGPPAGAADGEVVPPPVSSQPAAEISIALEVNSRAKRFISTPWGVSSGVVERRVGRARETQSAALAHARCARQY